MATKKDWYAAADRKYAAEDAMKAAETKAQSLSGIRGREQHGIGYWSNPDMEASRKKRLQMADQEVDVQRERVSRAKSDMAASLSTRPPMSKKWVEK